MAVTVGYKPTVLPRVEAPPLPFLYQGPEGGLYLVTTWVGGKDRYQATSLRTGQVHDVRINLDGVFRKGDEVVLVQTD